MDLQGIPSFSIFGLQFPNLGEVFQAIMWRQHELIYMSALGNCKDQPTWTLGILGVFFFLILFIWLCQVIGVACRIFNLRYSLWHLIPWPGIEPGALAWERGVLATGPARKPLSGTFMCGSSQHVSWHHPFARTQIWGPSCAVLHSMCPGTTPLPEHRFESKGFICPSFESFCFRITFLTYSQPILIT